MRLRGDPILISSVVSVKDEERLFDDRKVAVFLVFFVRFMFHELIRVIGLLTRPDGRPIFLVLKVTNLRALRTDVNYDRPTGRKS